MRCFNTSLEECGLFDLGFSGPKFVWSNGRFQERLDRALGNTVFFWKCFISQECCT